MLIIRKRKCMRRRYTTLRNPALLDASSPALPTLPALPDLANMTATFTNALNGLNPLEDANTSRALNDELAAVRSLATAIGAGLVANLPTLTPGSLTALTVDLPPTSKLTPPEAKPPKEVPATTIEPPTTPSEPEQISRSEGARVALVFNSLVTGSVSLWHATQFLGRQSEASDPPEVTSGERNDEVEESLASVNGTLPE
ncbi:hypothetical protein ZHAS_00009517 [Anopheles sinensis]|uniref:Uncharacterized protein n=1 Tax=Anopheles sinensis TaxID=74873 RepID=A0A084VVF7_ANOSI|nr:hypothetical protein ZHAS_00009517 [Anopheles sinensis]